MSENNKRNVHLSIRMEDKAVLIKLNLSNIYIYTYIISHKFNKTRLREIY